MAKFELHTYNMETEEVEKTLQRNIMPISLYIKFQQYSEKVLSEKVKDDSELYAGLCDLFVELFPEMTKDEYNTKTDPGEVLVVFKNILDKATKFEPGNAKNA